MPYQKHWDWSRSGCVEDQPILLVPLPFCAVKVIFMVVLFIKKPFAKLMKFSWEKSPIRCQQIWSCIDLLKAVGCSYYHSDHASATESMYGINFSGISQGTSLFLKERSQPKTRDFSFKNFFIEVKAWIFMIVLFIISLLLVYQSAAAYRVYRYSFIHSSYSYMSFSHINTRWGRASA